MRIKTLVLAFLLLVAGAMCAQGNRKAKNINKMRATEFRQELQGKYFMCNSATMGDIDMIHEYGMYMIKGDTIYRYSWDGRRRAWVLEYSSPFKLAYIYDNDYKTGFNILFYDGRYDQSMCCGDLDNDGNMDIWQSDSFYYTKQ